MSTTTATVNTMDQNSPIASPAGQPKVGIIMGSQSDWATMSAAAQLLADFDIAFDCEVVSAHRTPDRLFDYAKSAKDNGLQVIIAGAGGAAHLPGMMASKTQLPVLGVPMPSAHLNGLDSLYSIVQMPGGVHVATMAIGEAGATNAALTALRILAIEDAELAAKLEEFANEQGKVAEASTDELD